LELKTIIITQARTGSTRLPGKVLMEVNQIPLLKIHLDRLKKSKKVDKIIVATTDNVDDDRIEKMALEWGYEVYRGSENDVLDRFYQAVKYIKPLWIVRVTSDCPLIDPLMIDKIIEETIIAKKDYGSNGLNECYPDGQDVEVFTFDALEFAWNNAVKKSDREHVTTFIRNNSDLCNGSIFKSYSLPCVGDFSKIRMTVDEELDFRLIEIIIKNLGINKTWEEYTKYIIENDLLKINSEIKRNEGLLKSIKND
jgi:spore coat polysaccharide biosynthesis protein SpsF